MGSAALVGYIPATKSTKGKCRNFSLCTNTETLNKNPGFFNLIVSSGVTDVWLPLFLNGYWPYPMEEILLWNLSENKETFTLKLDDKQYFVEIGGLDAELVRL